MTKRALKLAIAAFLICGLLGVSFSFTKSALAASCSSQYAYQHEISYDISLDLYVGQGTPQGTLTAQIWSKYFRFNNQTIYCHQYHAVAQLCANHGVAFPAASLEAYMLDEAGGGGPPLGDRTINYSTLSAGNCEVTTSYDSLSSATPYPDPVDAWAFDNSDSHDLYNYTSSYSFTPPN